MLLQRHIFIFVIVSLFMSTINDVLFWVFSFIHWSFKLYLVTFHFSRNIYVKCFCLLEYSYLFIKSFIYCLFTWFAITVSYFLLTHIFFNYTFLISCLYVSSSLFPLYSFLLQDIMKFLFCDYCVFLHGKIITPYPFVVSLSVYNISLKTQATNHFLLFTLSNFFAEFVRL